MRRETGDFGCSTQKFPREHSARADLPPHQASSHKIEQVRISSRLAGATSIVGDSRCRSHGWPPRLPVYPSLLLVLGLRPWSTNRCRVLFDAC